MNNFDELLKNFNPQDYDHLHPLERPWNRSDVPPEVKKAMILKIYENEGGIDKVNFDGKVGVKLFLTENKLYPVLDHFIEKTLKENEFEKFQNFDYFVSFLEETQKVIIQHLEENGFQMIDTVSLDYGKIYHDVEQPEGSFSLKIKMKPLFVKTIQEHLINIVISFSVNIEDLKRFDEKDIDSAYVYMIDINFK